MIDALIDRVTALPGAYARSLAQLEELSAAKVATLLAGGAGPAPAGRPRLWRPAAGPGLTAPRKQLLAGSGGVEWPVRRSPHGEKLNMAPAER